MPTDALVRASAARVVVESDILADGHGKVMLFKARWQRGDLALFLLPRAVVHHLRDSLHSAAARHWREIPPAGGALVADESDTIMAESGRVPMVVGLRIEAFSDMAVLGLLYRADGSDLVQAARMPPPQALSLLASVLREVERPDWWGRPTHRGDPTKRH